MPQFHLVNSYGLFRQMTETRPELAVEYSGDGKTWQPVEFNWKPGPLDERPRFCAPHQPRLDWQMWFEALRWERNLALTGRVRLSEASPWFQRFIMRLLEAEPNVVRLVRSVPEQPEYLRVVLYQYRFTSKAEGKDGAWWERERVTASETVKR